MPTRRVASTSVRADVGGQSTLRYESRLIKRDAPVVALMSELSARYPRYGIVASRSSWIDRGMK